MRERDDADKIYSVALSHSRPSRVTSTSTYGPFPRAHTLHRMISVAVLCFRRILRAPSTLGKITRQPGDTRFFIFELLFAEMILVSSARERRGVLLGRVSGGKDELPRRKSASLYDSGRWGLGGKKMAAR